MSAQEEICEICGRTYTGLKCIRCTQAALSSLSFGEETLGPSVSAGFAPGRPLDAPGQPRLKGTTAGVYYLIGKPVCRVGHDRTNDIALVDDDSVSRFHAQIVFQDEMFVIRDLGTKEGTWINGERLEGEYRLFTGDQVRIGSTRLYFVED